MDASVTDSNRRVRTRTHGGVAGVRGRPRPLCRSYRQFGSQVSKSAHFTCNPETKHRRIASVKAISQHRRAHRIILLVVTVESVILRNLVTRKRHFNQSLEWHRLAILFGRRKMPLLYCIDGSLVQVWIEPTNNLHLINFALVIDCDR